MPPSHLNGMRRLRTQVCKRRNREKCDIYGGLRHEARCKGRIGLSGGAGNHYLGGAKGGGFMLFWAMAGLMAAGAAGAVLLALRRPPAMTGAHPDLGVYRAQLAEVDRDRARGLLGEGEAESLRTEIARRILELDRSLRTGPPAAAGGTALPALAVAGAVALSFALYWHLGAPGYPDVPHADRLAAAETLRAARPSQAAAEAAAPSTAIQPDAAYAELMDKLRASTVEFPDKAEGFRLLAQHEANVGNFAAAARARARLIEIEGPATALDHAELADLMIRAAGGIVTAEAEAELRAALKLDPSLGTARFYAGLVEAQTGRPDRAFALWRPLYEESPPDAPWMGFLGEQLPRVAEAAGVAFAPPRTKGPSAADVAAAGEMSAGDRAGMIAGMVEGLEARLMAEGGSAEDWARLLTALGVLGAPDRRAAALARAEAAYAGDAPALATIRAAAGAGP